LKDAGQTAFLDERVMQVVVKPTLVRGNGLGDAQKGAGVSCGHAFCSDLVTGQFPCLIDRALIRVAAG
jgi:hypothetical protein